MLISVIAATAEEPPALWYVVAAAYLLFLFSCLIATALKGKWGFLLAGILIHWFWIFGGIRLAKPGSYWARHFYNDQKRQRSYARYILSAATPRGASRTCPDCAEEVQAAANVCRFCGYRFGISTGSPAEAEAAAEAAPVAESAVSTERFAEAASVPDAPTAPTTTSGPSSAAWVLGGTVVVAAVVAVVFFASRDADGPTAPEEAVPATASGSANGGWQPIKHDYTRKFGVARNTNKRLRLLVEQGGLYISVTTSPDPDVVVKLGGATVSSYADAPTDPYELMWPISTAGQSRLEVLLRNPTSSTRVYTVGFFEVDASLISRSWDQVPGLPSGGDNPGASEFATAPADRYQRLELYDDGNAEQRLGQVFPMPARTRTKIALYPPYVPEGCFALLLRSENIGAVKTSFGSHRTVASVTPVASAANELAWIGRFSGTDAGGGYLAPRIDLSVVNAAESRLMARVEFQMTAC